MKVKNVKLSKCRIESDFKKTDENSYIALCKAVVGEEEFENIIYLELNEEQYNYINNFNYKEELLDVHASVQVRKNKKGLPYLFAKVNFIISTSEKLKIEEENIEKIKEEYKLKGVKEYKRLQRKKKNKKKKNIDTQLIEEQEDEEYKIATNNWIDYVPDINDKLIKMKLDKVKIRDVNHTKIATININKRTKRNIVAVRPIEDTDEYELVLGYINFLRCKLLNLEANVYIVNKTRKEFLKEIEEVYNKSKQEKKKENQKQEEY